ncbi:P-type DNA transfer ATPase VirB11 (plasmid) [Xanthomonas campestris pv. incanae]|nr:P-type DNA transfer ATPase VirB11 [Xanthomonas campestris pv. incanae]WDJ96267.1 P-type DNA transfer ATPase VirB11 [Xanthomonas campestris pv. incanae]
MISRASMNSVISIDKRATTVRELMKPLAPILALADVTELAVTRPGGVWANTRGAWVWHDATQLTYEHLYALANALAVYNGMPLRSILSVVLPDGERGQVVTPPACIDNTLSINIRKHAARAFSLTELEDQGVFSGVNDVSFNRYTADRINALCNATDMTRIDGEEAELLHLKSEMRWREFLIKAVEYKRNIIISGKTGSGKTTFARSLTQVIPTHERVVTIEDVHELKLDDHPNRVHLLYGTTSGRVSSQDALAACMRLSMDRILLAELRGDEAWDYLTSLNTGHPGSITTTHANNAIQTYERVASLVKKSPAGHDIAIDMIRQLLYTTLEVVLYYKDRTLKEVFYDPSFSKSKLAN